jgi:aminoglycoside phosphotransferase (APT) family kinase protein
VISNAVAIALIRDLLKVENIGSVLPAGEGLDHRVFDVNGVLVARIRKDTDEHTAVAIEREAALLAKLSRISPIPIPEVVAAAPQAGLLVFRRLPGRSLFDAPASNPLAFAEPLAEFILSIHRTPLASVEGLVGRDEYPLHAYLMEAADQMTHVAAHVTADQRRRVELFLETPPPPESTRRTLCHNDLGAEHILASDDRSKLTGVIDWSDAAIADPARDLGRLLRDFGFGVAETVVRRTNDDERTLMRALFYARCALLEDVAYGIDTSRPQYVAHALGRFAATFS